jgi:ABC-2 type transport system ATP-binding protein
MTAAALHGVTKRFGTRVALDQVDLAIEVGEVISLLGPNGAGKTTALSILLGLRRPDAGRAELFGEDPRRPGARAVVGVTPQEGGFPQTLRVGEVVDLVRAHFPNPAPRVELVERFALGPIVQRQTGGLSGGERRKLAVALAFAGRPRAVFLDEPTTGLDVEARRAAWREIAAYAAGGGTVVLTTHHLDEAETLAGRIVLLADGRVVAEGSRPELIARAAADGLEDAFLELTEAGR